MFVLDTQGQDVPLILTL